jgi:hypothetical protein
MIRSKKKEQEKRAHEAAYESQRVALKTVKAITPMKIEKRKVIYDTVANQTTQLACVERRQ